uniref:NADH-ubiquinone oxidoreductase chain 2 n=1 Tax=Notidobia ciliaris TaxID=446507 RepID=A0A7D7AFM8_9NEOP|nr:NADH dehydrogenase subunit 2 [Notidobia ciliaris]QNV11738.1 NADH dehydrogenase subunit 2 [Notidobia ciliaris]
MHKNFNLNKFMFFIIIMMSTLYAVSSNSWINIWMSMEINLMSFIPLMLMINNLLTTKSMITYFMVQAIASMNFLFIILLKTVQFKWFSYLNQSFPLIIMNLCLLTKMGMIPLYQWFPITMKNLTWLNCFILSTWQKIIPMVALSYCMIYPIIFMSIILSSIISSIMSFNQTNLKMLMSFSSINHMSWMLSTMLINMNLWLFYIILYSILNYIIMMSFNTLNMFTLMQIYMSKIPPLNKMMIMTNLFSLSGLPPFLGFLPKLLTINLLLINNNYLIIIILLMTSLINIFIYLRITFSSFMIINYEMKTSINHNYMNNSIYLFSLINSLWLIIITMMYILN